MYLNTKYLNTAQLCLSQNSNQLRKYYCGEAARYHVANINTK